MSVQKYAAKGGKGWEEKELSESLGKDNTLQIKLHTIN